MKKALVRYMFFFIAVAFLLTGILVLSAMIPRKLIKENVKESAELLCERKVFFDVWEDVRYSRIDRYADAILLNIAYSYDENKPLRSVMESSYYFTKFKNENENLLEAVTTDRTPNQQYIRYWHGSNVFVRPLLLLLDLRQIYILNAVLLAFLSIWLFGVLFVKKAYIPALALFAGYVATAVWFVPYSLEYTWTFLLMLCISIIGIHEVIHSHENRLGYLFLLSGILTSFSDFLSTETLTLTVPLLFVYWFNSRKRTEKKVRPVSLSLLWLVGYAGMWAMKWLLASLVLSENVLPYVTGHIAERIGVDESKEGFLYVIGAVFRNLGLMIPFSLGTLGKISCLIAGFCILYYVFVYRTGNIDWHKVLTVAFIGMIPYIRYIVLHNHSYMHFFFTYRAQLCSVISLVFLIELFIYGGRQYEK